jgi:raffinose/stachyose/melibiose transport system permease protein
LAASSTNIWGPRYRARTITAYIVLGICTFVALVPIALLVLTAFKSEGELSTSVFSLPSAFRLDNFVTAWERGKFGLYFRNSIVVVVPVVAASVVFSVLGGFAFGVLKPPGQKILVPLFLVGIAVPFEAAIIPLYYRMVSFQLINTFWALIWPQIALSVAFGVFWMRAAFLEVPREMIEAAVIDGASTWVSLWRVLAPLVRPSILTLIVLLSVWTWNEFLMVLVLATSDQVRTLPVGLAYFKNARTATFTLQAAGSIIVALPMIMLFVFFQRQFIRGLTSGAVRG